MNFLRSMRTRFTSRDSVRRHAWQSLANYTQQEFGLIFGVIMARILEPSDFGAFGFTAATVVIALIPANWSLAPILVTDGGKTPSLFRHATGFAWCAVFAKILIVFCLCSVFSKEQRWWIGSGGNTDVLVRRLYDIHQYRQPLLAEDFHQAGHDSGTHD